MWQRNLESASQRMFDGEQANKYPQKKIFFRRLKKQKSTMARRIGSAEAAVKRLTVEYSSVLSFLMLFPPLKLYSSDTILNIRYHPTTLCLKHRAIYFYFLLLHCSQSSKRKHRKEFLRNLTVKRITFYGMLPLCMNLFYVSFSFSFSFTIYLLLL